MAKKNAVVEQETRAVAQQGERNVYQQYRDENKQSGIEGELLRFTKQGDWVSGVDQDELEEGTELIMGINTLKLGWQKWQDQRPVAARLGLLSEGYRPVDREELGDLNEDDWEELDGEARDPWQSVQQVLMMDPKSGQVYTFVTSSKSGIAALSEVVGAYGDRVQDGEDKEAMPVVSLQSGSYKHKTYGKIMIPVFELTGEWVTPPEVKPAASSWKPAKTVRVEKGGRNAARANGTQRALPAPAKGRDKGKGGRASI